METETLEDKNAHAKAQAKAQYESIAKMVRNLDEDEAKAAFVESLEEAELRRIMAEDLEESTDDMDLEAITERIAEALQRDLISLPDFEWDEDEARQAIQEDPLSVQVRSGWCDSGDTMEAEEFQILLCTGGPAVRIMGELSNGEPSSAWIEYQDWFLPWTEWRCDHNQATLLAYCREFYFAE